MLIRYVFSAMNGVDSLSWFSTTLFVLATGIRPWSHLISRLQERTSDLQDAVEEPERERLERENGRKLQEAFSRLDTLERVVIELRAKSAKIAPLQEACDDLSEALGDMERSVLRHERKVEAARIAHGSRLSAMEHSVCRLEDSQRKQLVVRPSAQAGVTGLYIPVHPRLARMISWALEVPQKLHDKALVYLASNIPQRTIQQQQNSQLDTISPSPTITSIHNHSDSLHFFNGTPLETIPEADDSDSDNTYVSDKTSSPPSKSPMTEREKKSVKIKSRSRSRSHTGPRPSVQKPKTYSRCALDWAAAIVSWPYRCATKIIVLVVPSPILKMFV